MPRAVRITGIKGRRQPGFLTKVSGVAPYGAYTGRFNFGNKPFFSFKVYGTKELASSLDKYLSSSISFLYDAVEKSAMLVAKEAKNILTNGPYKAYDTGQLASDVDSFVEEFTQHIIRAVAGNFTVPYAIYVFYGTEKMAARPYLKLALQRKEQVIVNMIEKAFQKDYTSGLFTGASAKGLDIWQKMGAG